MSIPIPETSIAIMDRDDSHNTECRPVTSPTIETAPDTTLYYDWTDCASEPRKQDEPIQEAVKALEVCDGADPEAQENIIDSTGCDDNDSGRLDLDSILPMAEILTSILRYAPTKATNNRSYYFEGVATAEEMDKLKAYVRRVEAFTLTTANLHGFPSGTLLRLSMMRSWTGAFFPSLKILRVVHCDYSTMQKLNLFLSPSLESLEVTIGDSWDDDSEEALDIFLSTLSSEAPNLTCLKILSAEPATREFVSPITPGYSPFKHLHTLYLDNVVIQEWPGLEALGDLVSLEDLSLTISLRRFYTVRRPTSMNDGEWDVLSDCLPDVEIVYFGFPRLKRLRIAARIELLRDLLGYIESDNLTDLSITLLAGSRGAQALYSVRRASRTSGSPPPAEEIIAAIRSGRLRTTFRNEDEFFCLLLERAAEKWHELQSVTIDHRQPPNTVQRAHILSTGTLEKLLLHPQLRRLEISDWVTDFDIEQLIASHPPTHKSNLQILHLPTNASSYITTEGIPWTTLAIINKKLPNLTSFHGYLNRQITDIPDYTAAIPAEISPNCNVKTLTLGDGPISWDEEVDSDYLLRVGIYLYSLFPHLDDIIAQDDDGSHEPDWDYLRRLVKMCQASGRIGNHVWS